MLMLTSQTGSDIAFHHSDIEKQSYCWRLSKSHKLFYGRYIFLEPMCGTQKLTKNLEAHSNVWLKSRQCPSLQSGLKFHQIYDGQGHFSVVTASKEKFVFQTSDCFYYVQVSSPRTFILVTVILMKIPKNSFQDFHLIHFIH